MFHSFIHLFLIIHMMIFIWWSLLTSQNQISSIKPHINSFSSSSAAQLLVVFFSILIYTRKSGKTEKGRERERKMKSKKNEKFSSKEETACFYGGKPSHQSSILSSLCVSLSLSLSLSFSSLISTFNFVREKETQLKGT